VITLQIKRFFKGYNYLARTIITIILAFYIPFIIMGFLMANRFLNEMSQANKEYYLKNTENISQYFYGLTNSIVTNAVRIGLDRKISQQKVESHKWEIVEAIQILDKYKAGISSSEQIGIYFRDSDYVITSSYKYEIDDFISRYCYGNGELHSKFKSFFNNSYSSLVNFVSTFNDISYEKSVAFLGVPIYLNSGYRRDALVFYVLSYDSLKTAFLNLFGPNNYSLCIFDNNDNLIFTNTNINQLLEDKDFRAFLEDRSAQLFEYETDNNNYYYLYKTYDPEQKISFVTIVQRETAEEKLIKYNDTLRFMLLVSAFVMILVMGFAIYLNYKPIWQLFCRFRELGIRDKFTNELKYIEETFLKVNSEKEAILETAEEQRLILIDYLLNDLLHGNTVSSEDLKMLGIYSEESKFFVISTTKIKLDNRQRQSLISQLYEKCRCKMYIVDLPNEEHMVYICALSDDSYQQNQVLQIFEKLLTEFRVKYKLGAGNIVNKPEDIRSSYLYSLGMLNYEEQPVYQSEISGMVSHLGFYPTEYIMSFLQHLQQGDAEKACDSLSTLINCIDSNNSSLMIKRYICNDIFSEYIKVLYKMNIFLNNAEITKIINFSNIKEFYIFMVSSIKHVCNELLLKERNSQDKLINDIMDYVNQNYTDEDITLMKVADYFNLSIYTLSRLFKEHTGYGFKEYIVKKRIEYGKYLLLTTENSIKEISEKTGFVNAGYFSKIFKEHCGVSPSQFRENT